MIHYISPYRKDKDIGRAINNAIEDLSTEPNDWIVHMDHDAMFLLPDSKAQLETILNSTDFDILGPVTNRLGTIGQTMHGMFEERDMLKHVQLAQKVSDKKYGLVTKFERHLAAFCMCFKAVAWRDLGGFEENVLDFDVRFCKKAKEQGLKLGIMPGLYVFHLYRMGKDVNDYSHLI